MFYRKYVTWKRLKIVAIILGQLSHTKFANLVSATPAKGTHKRR